MRVEEGIDYIVTEDPQSPNKDDWCVIFSGHYDGLVGRYRDVQILSEGKALNYSFESVYVPPGMEQKSDFDELIKSVLMDVLVNQHERGGAIYYSKETGNRIDY